MPNSAQTFKEAFTKVVCIPLANLEMNDGQLDGLPSNPREIDADKYELLKANIKRYPEMLNYRGLIVYPLPDKDGKFIILCGNMRYRAMSELRFKDAPCQIIESGTDIETLKAYSMIDNNSSGNTIGIRLPTNGMPTKLRNGALTCLSRRHPPTPSPIKTSPTRWAIPLRLSLSANRSVSRKPFTTNLPRRDMYAAF